jgi:3-deoxy-manno-octulosonate cytidylyltransferase (CMP-KDO synthetase)
MALTVIGIIPARLQSTRLPKKMLRAIGKKPLIQHVWERCLTAQKLNRVIIATDHNDIVKTVKSFGGDVVLTDPKHTSGTDRIAEVAASCVCDVVINIQGDEPFISAEAIDALATAFEHDEHLNVATLCHRETGSILCSNPNVVKVVCDNQGNALYFSRALIPFDRENNGTATFLKHIGIYAFRKAYLLNFSRLPVAELEQREKLEQLRILSNGDRIKVIETAYDSFGIDTEDDLARANELYNRRQQ